MKNQISVIIHTLNEEKNIENCLRTVSWADEIILVDMHSTDRTVEIARRYTDKIYSHRPLGYADPARQFSLEKANYEWVLSVDADELVPYKLKVKLEQIIGEDLADVVYIPHNNYFAGVQVKGVGWGALQNLHPRLFKKSYIRFSPDVHQFAQINEEARILRLEDPELGFIHFSYVDVEHFIQKMNRYTTLEAENKYKSGERIRTRHLILRLLSEFRWRYFKYKGYKDGDTGLYLSLLLVFYRLVTYLKLYLMQKYETLKPGDKIRREYDQIAQKVIQEYDQKSK